ncbi:MAG: hypothetical protein ACO3A2_04570 [Bdellovibrionia bacterium]
MKEFHFKILIDLLSQPTAPFQEGHVISFLTQLLNDHGVPFFLDPWGNLILGVSSRAEYFRLIKTRDLPPLPFFIAHMDHPGFHGTRWSRSNTLEVQWLGGSPTEHLENARVWLRGPNGFQAQGKLKKPQLLESKKALKTAQVVIHPLDLAQLKRSGLGQKYKDLSQLIYGGFAFQDPVWQKGELIYTQAADDLVGCFALATLAIDYFKKHPSSIGRSKRSQSRTTRSGSAWTPPPFLALLSRAEEVGFIGTLAHLELGWLQKASRSIFVVSLETSRTLPGAEIGKGPVVRLGDRFTVFHPAFTHVLTELAQTTLGSSQFQRRIMDGGSCEASATTVYGLHSIGISVPLGNYHNQNFQGGEDACEPNGPAPEFVHQKDVEGLQRLCHAILDPKTRWTQPWKSKQAQFRKNLRSFQSLLSKGVSL